VPGLYPFPWSSSNGGFYLLRGRKVMLSPDPAGLYKVETRTLVQSVKRNLDRFPEDFMFQLTGSDTKS
jgi:hypothetical protein